MPYRVIAALFVALVLIPAPSTSLAQEEAPPPAPAEEEAGGDEVEVIYGPEEGEAKGASGVKGRVTDSKTGEGLIEATVKVVKGGKGKALTDVDGNFELELPPGKYELRVFYELYQGRRISGVVVVEGAWQTIDVALDPDVGAIEEVVVEEKADPKSEGAQLTIRKKAPVVQDTLSAQEISRTPDSNAGDAVKRVVSATVVGGKYVFVRGLGGRYSLTLLNGVVLPSPDPDNPSVPLDLFPASLLANLTVVKSYMSDLPGTFSGGALLIETNAYPDDFELKVKLGGSWDTSSTGETMLTYSGGDYDWLGFDSGDRALPDAIPADESVDDMSPEENAAAAKSFKNAWNLDERDALPNLSLSAQVGDTHKLKGGAKLGYLASVTYGHKLVVRRFEVARANLDSMGISTLDEGSILMGEESIGWGALGNIGLQLDRDNSVSMFTLFSRSADDKAFDERGFSATDNSNYKKSRLHYQARQLSFTQLAGRHKLKGGHVAELAWQGNFSVTTRGEPDIRDLKYLVDPMGQTYFLELSLSGERTFTELEDVAYGVGTDINIPWARGAFKGGISLQRQDRAFDARRLGYDRVSGADSSIYYVEDPEVMLSDANIGSTWLLEERTQADDSYEAERGVGAAYLMADVKLASPLRLVAGVRFEVSNQTITTGSPLASSGFELAPVSRNDEDFLPAISLVYAATDKMNLRVGYGYTLARPQFRELAPFLYYDFTRRRSVSGNPALENTTIHNGDLRWEWFPGSREVVAVSAFYKRFEKPIELIIKNPSLDSLFENTTEADVYGLEFEARGSFGRFSKALADFRGAANLTLVSSEIDVSGATGSFTNDKRRLQGQSPYVFNMDLGWANEKHGVEISLLYNVYGSRLSEVGTSGLPDIFESAFHRFDISAAKKLNPEWRLKVTGTNLLDQDVVFEQGPVVVQRYAPGVAVGASLEWAPK